MVKIHQHVKFQANPSMHSPANARKPLRTDGQTDVTVKWLRLVGWTNGPMYRSKEGISGFGRTDGRTDGQPENIMPPAPKGRGIKITTTSPCFPSERISITGSAGWTHLLLDKMAAISQTIFSDAFFVNEKFCIWVKNYWSLFVRAQLTITQHWFRYWLVAE